MADTSWLHTYFGGHWMKQLNPSIVADGKFHAVLKVSQPGEVNYILVQKRGVHAVTPHQVLGEGVLSQDKLEKMIKRMKKADGEL